MTNNIVKAPTACTSAEQLPEYFYNLLPVVYQNKDQTQADSPGVLRALCALMDTQYWSVYHDIQRLYDGWFIDSCPNEIIPCIADTLGLDLMPPDDYAVPQRAHVGHYVRYYQNKGTADMLSMVCKDITGWHAYALAMNKDVAFTQNTQFPDMAGGHILDLSAKDDEEEINNRLAPVLRNVDLRSNNSLQDEGFMPSTLGLFLWPLQVYPIDRREARQLKKNLYSFNPFGAQQALYNYPRHNRDNLASWHERMVTLPLEMTEDLFFRSFHDPEGRLKIAYSADDGALIYLHAEEIEIHDLPSDKVYANKTGKLWIDLKRGRMVTPDNWPANVRLYISGCYAFSGDIGGGTYTKPSLISQNSETKDKTWQGHIASDPDVLASLPIGSVCYPSINAAMQAWQQSSLPHALITVCDSGIYDLGAADLTLQSKQNVTITAGRGCMPTFIGHFTFQAATGHCATIELNGLQIDGTLTFDGELNLTLFDCTVSPGVVKPVISNRSLDDQKHVQNQYSQSLTLDHCITGPIILNNPDCELTVQDCIIDTKRLGRSAIHIKDNAKEREKDSYPQVKIHASTVHGLVKCPVLHRARNSLFAGAVKAGVSGEESVRFCYLGDGSTVIAPMDCIHASEQDVNGDMVYHAPIFTSIKYGQAGYMHLDMETDEKIRGGGRDSNEVGAFYHLKNRTRLMGLKHAQHEYFPLDMNITYIFEL